VRHAYADGAACAWRRHTRALLAAGILLPVAPYGAGMLLLRGMRCVEQEQRAALLWGYDTAAGPGESGLKIQSDSFVAISPGFSVRGWQ